MKRILSLVLISMIVLSTFSILSPQVEAEPDPATFQDDFEGYDVGIFPHPPWDLWFSGMGTSEQRIVDTEYVSGTKSLRLYGRDMWAAAACKPITITTDVIGYEVKIKVENFGVQYKITKGAQAGFSYKRSSTLWTNWALVGFLTDGNIRASGEILQAYNLDTWYKIRTIYDIPKSEFSVWIDDQFKGTFLETNTFDPALIEAFGLGSNHGEQVCYFDDVKVFTPQAILFSLAGPQTDKTLISIDPNTASTSVIGKVGGGHDLEGLAYNPDDRFLYGSTGWKNPGGPALVRIDPSTGASETVGRYSGSGGEPNEIDSLSFHPITGVLYGVNEGGPPSGGQLCTIDINTGRATIIGDLGDSFGGGDPGIAFDSTGTLYGVSKASDQLFTIDITTGTASGIGPLGFDSVVGLDFNPNTGVPFGIDIDSRELITIDKTTGHGTLVGVLTGPVTEYPVALAFARPVEGIPVAILSASPTIVDVGEDVTFDAPASYDPDGTVEYYWFDYGDGADSGWISSPTSTHSYTESGIYYAKVKVKDNDGLESEWSEQIKITADYIQLAKRYFPYLTFDEEEEYFPTDFYCDDENITNNPSNYTTLWPKTAYIHTVQGFWEEQEYLVIEYWFYYAKDIKLWDREFELFDFQIGAHDQDWESVYVFLEKTALEYEPSLIAYFGHRRVVPTIPPYVEDFYHKYNWSCSLSPISPPFKTINDTHPIVHIGLGSHASYPGAVPILDIGWPVYIFPWGDWLYSIPGVPSIPGLPCPEPVDSGNEFGLNHFDLTFVPSPNPTWPQENFGEITTPWNKSRWDDPWYLLVQEPVLASMSVVAGSPVNVLITDPQERKVGYDPETENVVNDIPGASYSGSGTEPQIIWVPDPLDGNYVVTLIGTATGAYSLTTELIFPEAIISQTYTGGTAEDAVYVYTVSITDEVMTTSPDAVAELEYLKEFIDGLPYDSFDKPKLASQRKNALFNKIDEVILKVEAGNYTDAINKLLHDIRAKIDGDSTANDWIIDPETQDSLCVFIDHIISSIKILQQA